MNSARLAPAISAPLDCDRGEGVAYTADALKDITQSAIGAMHGDKPMDPDVLP